MNDESPMDAADRCGTYSGYQRHRKQGEKACTPCLVANREYMAEWRRRFPKSAMREASKQMARDRALRRLAQLHPADMRALYEEELRRLPRQAAS